MRSATLFGQNAVDEAAYQGWSGVLSGCVPDARDMALVLGECGFEAEAKFSGWNVDGSGAWPWRLSLACTRKAWRDAHADLQRAAKAGDVLALGNSGHGGRGQNTVGGTSETLCFADGQMEDGEFHNLMAGWPAGVKVVYFLDTCHSGGMDRDLVRFPVRASPGWLEAPPAVQRSGDIRAAVLQFCACKYDETASDGPHNGAWTGALLAAWEFGRKAGERLTWARWFELASAAMTIPFPGQHPVLNVLGAGGPALLQEAVGG